MNQIIRQTKIIATLGPSTDKEGVLEKMILAGLNVARVNFSHGSAEDQIMRTEMVREIAAKNDRVVGVMGDLQGPKIRIGRFANGAIQLSEEDAFILDMSMDENSGDQEKVGVAYKNLIRDVKSGDILFLDDGNIVLEVDSTKNDQIFTTVRVGGELSNNKGINLKGGGLSAPTLTEKDHADIVTAAKMKADFLALSFVRNGVDIEVARELFKAAGGSGKVIAKIERTEAIKNIDAIIEATDAVMLARGDLGIEIGDAELPGVQKSIIKKARERNRVCIVATHMMQSMVESPMPTRAEVMDVANAVMDGTDAVMLSAETAVGKYPVRVIEAVDRVCVGAEKHHQSRNARLLGDGRAFERTDEAIAMAAMFMSKGYEIKAIVSLTESGDTAKWLSRVISDIPIYAVSRHTSSHRRVTLFRGVHPINYDVKQASQGELDQDIAQELIRRGLCQAGDRVILTQGDCAGVKGGTNSLKIIKI